MGPSRFLRFAVPLGFAALASCGRDPAPISTAAAGQEPLASPTCDPGPPSFLAGWAEVPKGVGTTPDGLPMRVKRTRDGAEMVLVPAGEFRMGAEDDDVGAPAAARPAHPVAITKAYYLDVTEVTNERFQRFLAETGRRTTMEESPTREVPVLASDGKGHEPGTGVTWREPFPGRKSPTWAKEPVVWVSWKDAKAYAEWAGADLPTEAQWERAARAGEDRLRFPWGDSLPPPPGTGNLTALSGYENGRSLLAPAASYEANPFGLCDMVGNAQEWCLDRWSPSYGRRGRAVDPAGPATGSQRVIRGSWWSSQGDSCRSCYRSPGDESMALERISFRCARSVP